MAVVAVEASVVLAVREWDVVAVVAASEEVVPVAASEVAAVAFKLDTLLCERL